MKKDIFKENIKNNKRIVFSPDYRDLGAILLFIFLVPYIISFLFGSAPKEEKELSFNEVKLLEKNIENSSYIVYNTTAAGTEKMPLETYLVCRLPATIDTTCEPETLKAQAVVLRTELIKKYYDENTKENNGIYVSSRLSAKDGKEYERCQRAVSETKGMYLTYKGKPIKAPYFNVSAGATRNGNEVFDSEEYPYLKSVRCDRDFTAEEYMKTVKVNKKAFILKLKELLPEVNIEEAYTPENLKFDKDRAGYVKKIIIENKSISGEAFREAFSLYSSYIEIEEEKKFVRLKTKGIGHGLGLCQFGANEAAKRGSDFIDILNYFFTDIVIEKIE